MGAAMRPTDDLFVINGLMAATVWSHGLTLMTRNIRDFAVRQVPIINHWE
jgi:predicted nucleic acid-binding protein